jgi:hypothetical protein
MVTLGWGRVLATWAAMAVAMTANGIFRETVLKGLTSSRVADVLSALIGIGLIATITGIGFRAAAMTAQTRALVFTSLILVLLTIAFECAVGILVDQKSWTELAAHYAIWRGELWPIVLAFVACTPFLWGRWLR